MSGATTLRCSRARTSPVANDASSEGGGGKGDLEDVHILQDEDETSILCSAVAFDQDSEKEKIAATINNSDTREVTHRDASSPLITEDGVDDLISEDGGINLMKMFNVYIVVMGD